MEKLIFNPSNKKYYSEDFIKGFECGVERQYKKLTDGDLISREEVLKEGSYYSNRPTHTFLNDVVKVLPAYSAKSDGDLISRDYTIQQIQKAKENNYNFNYDTLIDFIKALPSTEKAEKTAK